MDINSVKNDGRISGENILNALVNLKQLVFEVTDACNLQCKYCAYGDLYFGYDKRADSFMNFEQGKAIIDYLETIWAQNTTNAICPKTFISFYGGEPLLNMDFIKAVVKYIESKDFHRKFTFSLTTNGVLLDRYISFFVEHQFNLLVSLDGDSKANAYRITHSGAGSFQTVYSNLKIVQKQYPEYFREHINFNTVLHNLNSVESSYNYILKEFGKETTISELNNANIKENKADEFLSMYRNKLHSLQESTDPESLSKKIVMGDPLTRDLLLFLHHYSGNVFQNYSNLLLNDTCHQFCPTGTCIPFGKKLFVTVNGKILQCEKISQKYALGYIDNNNRIQLNIDSIADSYNAFLNKVQKQCSKCYRKKSCIQCMYYINGIDSNAPKCQGFMNKEAFNQYSAACLAHLKNNPDLYEKLLNDIIID